ncbi:MAG: HD domain-containing protein, partial [Gammaproteobacteria bacterium]|nr:HD domain-containing protein [Gammaproteobacteria bacterium]NIR96341.1 HD domain-containing protein [Gammaproteobacteria bacterium]NIW47481.1 HD domain-containing protein [Gammaproteobacteria bacterium]NIW97112.1 HD domain-containing protein [Phycisphaerae bacterium]
MFNVLVKLAPAESEFLSDVKSAMEQYFGDDQRRVEHALQVSMYAEELLSYVDADPVVVLSAAYLHDIGIHEAERKHGSSSGKWQEIEGPPVARDILERLSAEPSLLEHVLAIVAAHHTSGGVDSPEFRVIWDADALVNFADVLPGKNDDQIEAILNGHMVTESGYQLARRIFIKNTERHKTCLQGHRPKFLP